MPTYHLSPQVHLGLAGSQGGAAGVAQEYGLLGYARGGRRVHALSPVDQLGGSWGRRQVYLGWRRRGKTESGAVNLDDGMEEEMGTDPSAPAKVERIRPQLCGATETPQQPCRERGRLKAYRGLLRRGLCGPIVAGRGILPVGCQTCLEGQAEGELL